MPPQFVQFDQVSQLTVSLASGKTRVGSGFLLAERLVLTAAHVLRGDSELVGPIRISLPYVGASATGSSVWSGSAMGLDAALIELDQPPAAPQPVRRRPVRWGRLTGQQPGVPATAVGFPRVLRADDGQRSPDQLDGRINPGVAMGQRYDLSLDGVPPQSKPGRRSLWSGLSGAALFSGNLLIGVLVIDTPEFQSGRLTAVPAWRLLADQGFAAQLRRHSCSTEVESVELSGLFERPGGRLDSPAALLRADRAIVRFRGREHELDLLRRWCTSDEPLAMALVTGLGGQGKTRVAGELCRQMRQDGWLAGAAANTEQATRAAERLADSQLPVLVAVDYAETRTAQLGWLLDTAKEPSNRVRLLLLARSAGDWWTRLQQQHASVPAMQHALPLLESSTTGRAGAYRQALQDFATHLPGLDSGTSPWLEIASRLSVADAQQPAAGTVLQVHTAALIALLQAGPNAVSTEPGDRLEDVLLKHEQEYWRKTAEDRHLDYQPETLRNAVAAAALLGAAQQREGLATLTRVTGLRDQPEDRLMGVGSWLHDLYPPTEDQYWGSLQPDRLAEHFAGQIARLDPDLIVQLLEDASDAQKYQAFSVFARASVHQPHLSDVLQLTPVERVIASHGDVPSADAAMRELLQTGVTLLALGEPDEFGLAHLLHCTVPMAGEVIPMLPVFTRLDFLMAAVQMNEEWRALHIVEVESQVILREIEEREWLGINPWSGREFKLPAVSRPGELGRDEDPVVEHREALRVDPDKAGAYEGLRKALTELGRFAATFLNTGLRRDEEAQVAHREALRHDPGNAVAHTGLGDALSWLGRDEEAEAAYREALRLDPDNAAAHTGLGGALTNLGRDEEAEAAYREALRIDPDDAAGHARVGNTLYALGRYAEAEAAYREALRLNTYNDASARTRVGDALYALGRYAEAEAAYREAVRLDPYYATAHNNLGHLYLKILGKVDDAESALREALRLDPDNVSAHGNLGSLYVVTGDLDAARLSFMRATQSAAGKHAGSELMLGALDREADPSAAEARFTAALDALEQSHQSRYMTPFGRAEIQALALVALDRSSEAIAVFSSAASTRSGMNVFQRKDYELFGAPELAAGLNALFDIWRDIIAKDNSAAGPWGGPRRIS